MIEYSSPNTNKPLHVGHLRNNFLGQSLCNIYTKIGYEVVKTCIVNDRGIHICKSMIAWQQYGNNETPNSTHKKGDHFVGDYYVKFNEIYKQEAAAYTAKFPEKIQEGKIVNEQVPILLEAQEMLQKWENNDPVIRTLWTTMNNWVYSGFDETYKRIGTTFDKIYYESEIYLLGKSLVELGLQKKVFYKAPDNSVWIDLSKEGYDQKIVQRKDGTSVYITQDLALANLKQQDYHANKSMYIVGDEQNYHFQVLKLICEKLEIEGAEQIFHLSYGMVELPSGKMKSREGTVVDADDLIDAMIEIAKQKTNELSKTANFNEQELLKLYNTIGLGALKFFLLRVSPANKMVFNPEESIDFKGFTAPFIQYTHARIQS
ncbi:MAG: arginine--tRNA ligase, partial [Sediminibacterium sp.]|nr:arginine--tRNA ligase [Sediminibacterium sp.]